jgi:hypothetical protein
LVASAVHLRLIGRSALCISLQHGIVDQDGVALIEPFSDVITRYLGLNDLRCPDQLKVLVALYVYSEMLRIKF